jgi:outer membrane protein assembly factor BamB
MLKGAKAALVCVVTGGIVSTFAFSGVSSAASPASIQVRPDMGHPQQDVTVSGMHFGANRTMDVTFDGTLEAHATSDAAGAFSTVIVVPADATPGGHVITAHQVVGTKTASKNILVRTNWPGFAGNSHHTSSNQYENVLTPRSAATLTQLWNTPDPAGSVPTFGPAIVNGLVYAADDNGQPSSLRAYDAATGRVVWATDVTDGGDSTPAVQSGLVVLEGTDSLAAYDASTGALRWVARGVPGGTGSVTVVSRTVYVGTGAGVFAVDLASGAVLWGFVGGSTPFLSAAFADGRLFAASHGGMVYAIDPTNGQVLWTVNIGTNRGINASPVVGAGALYVGDDSFAVHALDSADGRQLWSAPQVGNGGMALDIASRTLYTIGNGLHAINVANGAILWTQAGVPGDQTPAVADGVVYAESDAGYRAYDAQSGSALWTGPVACDTGTAGPAVVNGDVFVGSCRSGLFAFGTHS